MRTRITVRIKKRPAIVFAAIAAVVLTVGTGLAVSGEEGDEGAGDMDAMMQAFMEKAQPGEHHAHLDRLAGSWTYTAKMFAPGQDPVEASGSMQSDWLLGGRFLHTDVKGEFMGMAFQGYGLDGFDTINEKYTAVWMDTMGTFMMNYGGSCENDGKLRVMYSEFTDPMSGQKMKTKSVTTVIDDDHYKYEAYLTLPDGSEFKQMEFLATRQ